MYVKSECIARDDSGAGDSYIKGAGSAAPRAAQIHDATDSDCIVRPSAPWSLTVGGAEDSSCVDVPVNLC